MVTSDEQNFGPFHRSGKMLEVNWCQVPVAIGYCWCIKTSQKNRLRILLNFFARLSQFALLLKRSEFCLEMKKGDRARVQTEMVEFIAVPFPFSSKLKIWSFHVVV